MDVDDGTKSTTTPFLDYLFESVCRTRALLFASFSITDVLYDTTTELLQYCGFQYPPVPVLEALVGETERIMVFAEGLGAEELKNLEAVLRGLGVETSDRRLCYSRALLVVVDRVSGIPVNVEPRHCWWASSEYNIGGGPDFFNSVPINFMANAHRLLKACHACSEKKGKCRKTELGNCTRCVNMGINCVAGPTEAYARRRETHKIVKSQLPMLNAVHQYVVVTHGRRLNEQIMAAAQVERLLAHVLANTLPSWNHEMELRVQEYSDSFQDVAIEDGKIRVDREKGMEEWWGYEKAEEGMSRDARRTLISPHLGMCSSQDAILFIDHALRKPGELFFRDDCILNRAFRPVNVRIMVVAAIVAPARIRITLGWKKP